MSPRMRRSAARESTKSWIVSKRRRLTSEMISRVSPSTRDVSLAVFRLTRTTFSNSSIADAAAFRISPSGVASPPVSSLVIQKKLSRMSVDCLTMST